MLIQGQAPFRGTPRQLPHDKTGNRQNRVILPEEAYVVGLAFLKMAEVGGSYYDGAGARSTECWTFQGTSKMSLLQPQCLL